MEYFWSLVAFVEFSQFLSGETKVSNKNKGVELTSMKTKSAKNNIPATLIIIGLFPISMLSVFHRG